MNQTPPRARDTRTRLLDTAERLFAERGLEATSVRDIVSAARANLGAITYHFGAKDALIRAVLERRLLPLNAERVALLDAAEQRAGRGGPPLEAVLRAILAPTLRLWRTNPWFMRFFGRLHDEPRLTLKKCAEAAPVFRRFHAAIARAVPHLPPEEIAWRLFFIRGALIHTWTGADRLATVMGLAPITLDEDSIIERLIAFAAAGLRAPAPRARRARRARATERARAR